MSKQNIAHVYQTVHEVQECEGGFRTISSYHSEIYAGTSRGLEAAINEMHKLVEKCKDENFGRDKCSPRCRSRIASLTLPSEMEKSDGMVLRTILIKNRYKEEREYDPEAPLVHYEFWVYKKGIVA